MPDQLDQAAEITDLHRDFALKHLPPPPIILETGRCLHCDTPVPLGRRWCDAECRDEWQREQQPH